MARKQEDRYPTATALADEVERGTWPTSRWPCTAIRLRAISTLGAKTSGTRGRSDCHTVRRHHGPDRRHVLLEGKNRKLDDRHGGFEKTNASLDQSMKDGDAKRQQAETARDQARQRYVLALEAFNDMVFGIQKKLENRPGRWTFGKTCWRRPAKD